MDWIQLHFFTTVQAMSPIMVDSMPVHRPKNKHLGRSPQMDTFPIDNDQKE